MSAFLVGTSRSRLWLLFFGLLSATPCFADKSAEKKVDKRDTVSELTKLYKNGEYSTGLKLADPELSSPGLDKQKRVTLLLFRGIFSFQLREKEQSAQSFDEAFALAPEERLPVQVAPKVEAFADSRRPKPASTLRSHAWIPVFVGGALCAAGGIVLNDAPRRPMTQRIVGFSLLGAGVVGLVGATGMYLFGGPKSSAGLSVGFGTDGTSAFVHGRWP